MEIILKSKKAAADSRQKNKEKITIMRIKIISISLIFTVFFQFIFFTPKANAQTSQKQTIQELPDGTYHFWEMNFAPVSITYVDLIKKGNLVKGGIYRSGAANSCIKAELEGNKLIPYFAVTDEKTPQGAYDGKSIDLSSFNRRLMKDNEIDSSVIGRCTEHLAYGDAEELFLQDATREIDAFLGISVTAAREGLGIDKARLLYVNLISRVRDEIWEKVRNGELTLQEGAESANNLRNDAMMRVRAQSSAYANALATELKATGKTLQELQDAKTLKKFPGRRYSDLKNTEKDIIARLIIESSGKPNIDWVYEARDYGLVGKSFLLAMFAMSLYRILYSDNKLLEAFKEGTILSSGFLVEGLFSTWLAGFVASSLVIGLFTFIVVAGATMAVSLGFDFVTEWFKGLSEKQSLNKNKYAISRVFQNS